MKNRLPIFSFILLAAISLGGVPRLLAQRERLPFDDVDYVDQHWPNAVRTSTSLRYVIVEPGDAKGPSPVPGNYIKALYKGMLLHGKVFDEAKDPENPLRMRLGRNNFIAGWEEMLQKMHRGEKIILIVPPELGYGSRGRPPEIPPEATLVFEMQLLDFEKD